MPFDYVAAFPIPVNVMPPKLRGLLEPIGLSPNQVVEVASKQESNPHGAQAEHLRLLMTVCVIANAPVSGQIGLIADNKLSTN